MKKVKFSKTIIDLMIESLKSIERFDLDSVNNGEFIENVERSEEDGKYIKAEDLMVYVEELECVKNNIKEYNKSLKEKKKNGKRDWKKIFNWCW